MATPIDPDGEFLDVSIQTLTHMRENALRGAQQELLSLHAPFSDIVAHPTRYNQKCLSRIHSKILELSADINRLFYRPEGDDE